ncbi:MAG: alpha-amylase family glycosyl hydrolase, partial [Saprospiraceae bacterium]
MNKLYLLLILGLMLTACKNDESTEAVPVIDKLELPEWASDAVIYEANIRQMTEEGTFNAFSEHLERIANIGIELVWLMPIHPISEKNRKARGDLFAEDIEDPEERKKYLGSPYSVADYRAVNPDYGTMDDFRNLLAKAHELGLKVIIDWVPNHTGWDNPWITEHPDWYTWDDEG